MSLPSSTDHSVPAYWNLGRSRLIAYLIEGHFCSTHATVSAPQDTTFTRKSHHTLPSCVVRQQLQKTPKLARRPIARSGSRKVTYQLHLVPCRVPAQSDRARANDSQVSNDLSPWTLCPSHDQTKNKYNSAALRTPPRSSKHTHHRNRNHEPTPAEQGGHQRTSSAAPAQLPHFLRCCTRDAARDPEQRRTDKMHRRCPQMRPSCSASTESSPTRRTCSRTS